MTITQDEKLFQVLKSLAQETSESGRIVEISNKADFARKINIRPQHLNTYLDRLITKRKIRLVYEIIDDETVKDMATKKAAVAAASAAAEVVEKKLASLWQELEDVKQRLTDLETQTKQTPNKTAKQRKLIE
ncbi:MAG: hypothetical protein J6P19_00185 [Acetobacter sp.]|nr:hypothetical protein [Acetobacter sp.]